MRLSQSPLNRKIKKEVNRESDFREEIDYRENLSFKVISENKEQEIDKSTFWEKLDSLERGETLIINDQNCRLQLIRTFIGDRYLQYKDERQNSFLISKLSDLSRDFLKDVAKDFCQEESNWKKSLEWKRTDQSIGLLHFKNFGYLFLMLLGGFAIHLKLNSEQYSEQIVGFLQAEGINVMLAMVIFWGLFLLFDYNNLKNFDKIGDKAKFWVGAEIFGFCMSILFLFFDIFNVGNF